MRCSLPARLLALLVANSFFASTVVFAQQGAREGTRPRRSQAETTKPTTTPGDADTGQSKPPAKQWNLPTNAGSPITQIESLTAAGVGVEPTMRIALATDVRSATVSTNGHLLSATDLAQTFVPLDIARVHVEARLLSPLPAPLNENFSLRIAGLGSRAEADEQAKLIREATSEQSQVVLDVETSTWGLLIGPHRSREDADAAQVRLEEAGITATVIDLTIGADQSPVADSNRSLSTRTNTSPTPVKPNSAQPGNGTNSKTSNAANMAIAARPPANNPVRLAARTSVPTRELVASGGNAGRLFSSSTPVMFASDDEAKAPVRFNDKAYRGRIEVFANNRGLLTVVNVIGLEDYVRGVVANELSPGGYPAIEALKAQAIAARTYAVKNRGQFMAQGFDLLPTTRSQVYRGLTSEQPLSTRAVDETRGMIATYNGEPINALYTSTCGGRTENAGSIFNEDVPYLRSRECAVEGRLAFAPFTIKSSREVAELKEEQHVPLARAAAILSVHNFGSLAARVSDSWLSSPASSAEVRSWLVSVAALAHQSLTALSEEANRPAGFATALSAAVFGESRADTLLNNADVEYLLAIRDANEVPTANRADVAMMIRDGYLSIFPDLTLRPRETMSRARVLLAIVRLMENRGLLQLQKGTARPTTDGLMILRSAKGKDQPTRVSADVYIFRQIGDSVYPVRSVALVGGEPVSFHVNSAGAVDYLEVRPAQNGAAADRFSPFTNWVTELSPGAVRARLGRAAQGVGSIVDLRVISRGASRRVTDLEVVGTEGNAHVRGGRIRSALGLREQLFVIDRRYDTDGHVAGFVFTGRGWGHGVGMCQVGAYGLARQGWTHEQILKAYYTGIEVTRAY
jgi:stage II sporulation protein D